MKIVLDTNVLVSGLLSAEGPCGQIVGLVAEGVLEPCMDERIFAEYEAVLSRPELKIDGDDVAAILEVIRDNGEMVTPPPVSVDIVDPGDVCFLEVAAATGAVLVTGNARHFPGRARAAANIMTPRELIEFLREPR